MARPFILTAEVQVRANRSSIQQTARQIQRGLSGVMGGAGGVSVGAPTGGGGGGGVGVAASQTNRAATATATWARNQASVNRNLANTRRLMSTTIRDIATLTGGVLTLRSAFMSLAAGMRDALDFERIRIAMRQIGKEGDAVIGQLSADVRKVALDYNVSAQAIGKSVITLQQAGKGAADISKAMKTFALMSKNSQIGAENLNTATNALIVFENVFGKTIADAERSMNQIIALSKTQYITADEIASSSTNLANSVRLLGLEYEDMLAVLAGTKHQTGQSANKVSMGLRTFFARITTGQTGKRLEDQFGIHLFDKNDQFIGMINALDLLDKKMKELGEGSRGMQELLETLGGKRRKDIAGGALLALPQIKQNLEVVSGPLNDLQDDAAIAMNSVTDSVTGVKEAFNDLFRTMLEGPMGDFIKQILRLTESLLESKTAVAALMGVIAIGGGQALGKMALPMLLGGARGRSGIPKTSLGNALSKFYQKGHAGTAFPYHRPMGGGVHGPQRVMLPGPYQPGKLTPGIGMRAMGAWAKNTFSNTPMLGAGSMMLGMAASNIDAKSESGVGFKSALSGASTGLMALALGVNPVVAGFAAVAHGAVVAGEELERLRMETIDRMVGRASENALNSMGGDGPARARYGAARTAARSLSAAERERNKPASFFTRFGESLTDWMGFSQTSGLSAQDARREGYRKTTKQDAQALMPLVEQIREEFMNSGAGMKDYDTWGGGVLKAMDEIADFADDGMRNFSVRGKKAMAQAMNELSKEFEQQISQVFSKMATLDRFKTGIGNMATDLPKVRNPFEKRGKYENIEEGRFGTARFHQGIKDLPLSGAQTSTALLMNAALSRVNIMQQRGIAYNPMGSDQQNTLAMRNALLNSNIDPKLVDELMLKLGSVSAASIESGDAFARLREILEGSLGPLRDLGASLQENINRINQMRVDRVGALGSASGARMQGMRVADTVARTIASINGGEVNHMMANSTAIREAGGTGADLANRLAALREEFQRTKDVAIAAEMEDVKSKLKALGDVTSRTADIMGRINRVQGSLDARAGFREKLIFSEGKERAQIMRDARMADFASRRGTLQGLNEEQVRSALRGLNNSSDILWRGGGRFGDGKHTYADIKTELLGGKSDQADRAELKQLQNDYLKVAKDSMIAWKAVGDDWSRVAKELENAIRVAQGKQPKPIPQPGVGGAVAPGAAPGQAPRPPQQAPQGVPNAQAGQAAAQNMQQGADKFATSANIINTAVEMLGGFVNMFTGGVEKFGQNIEGIPNEITFKDFESGSLPQNFGDVNATSSQKRAAMDAMHGFSSYMERARYMRWLKKVEANWDDYGPQAAMFPW